MPVSKSCFAILFACIISSYSLAQEIRLSVYTEYPATIDTLSNRPGAYAFMTFFEALMKEADIPYNILTVPARRAKELTQATHNALTFPLSRTPLREADFNWVGKLVRAPSHTYLIKLEEREDIVLTSIESARNYSIGLIGQNHIYEYFQDLEFENLQPVNEYEQNIQKLIMGRIDLMAQGGAEIYPLCERTDISCDLLAPALEIVGATSGLHLAMGEDTDPEIFARMVQAYETLVADGTYDEIFGEIIASTRTTMLTND